MLVRSVRLFLRFRQWRLPAVNYWHKHSLVTLVAVHLVRPVTAVASMLTVRVRAGRVGRGARRAAGTRGLPQSVDAL